MTELYELQEQGYCVFEQVFEPNEMAWLQQACQKVLSGVSQQHRDRNRSQGSLVLLADHPPFGRLLGHPRLSEIFRRLKFADPRFSSGYIISKPPQGPPLFWHQDWWGWNDPSSYTPEVAQVFVMIYLQETRPQNGCLRVIPRSHHVLHEFHQANAHTEALSRVENPEDPLFQPHEDQVAVPVNCGDVVVGDARLIHGAFANAQAEERTLITLWFHPNFQALAPALQSRICDIFLRKGHDTDPGGAEKRTLLDWPEELRRGVDAYFPEMEKPVPPNPWCRVPERPGQGGAQRDGSTSETRGGRR